jgi:hypothetical protein
MVAAVAHSDALRWFESEHGAKGGKKSTQKEKVEKGRKKGEVLERQRHCIVQHVVCSM